MTIPAGTVTAAATTTTPATHVPGKFVERLLSALTTIVLIATGTASIFAFINAGKEQPIPWIGIAVLIVIVANLSLSIGSVIWKAFHLGAILNQRAYWLGGAFCTSVFIDVFALLYALGTFAQSGMTMWIMIGILLAIDTIIDTVIHFAR